MFFPWYFIIIREPSTEYTQVCAALPLATRTKQKDADGHLNTIFFPPGLSVIACLFLLTSAISACWVHTAVCRIINDLDWKKTDDDDNHHHQQRWWWWLSQALFFTVRRTDQKKDILRVAIYWANKNILGCHSIFFCFRWTCSTQSKTYLCTRAGAAACTQVINIIWWCTRYLSKVAQKNYVVKIFNREKCDTRYIKS